MADERRVLSALERLRVHSAMPLDPAGSLDGKVASGSLGGAPRAPWRAVETTPSRRKSSALTLSHLTPATPPQRNGAESLVSDAVRDIARELEAVEARLSVFRERRDAPVEVVEKEEAEEAREVAPSPVGHGADKETPGSLPFPVSAVALEKTVKAVVAETASQPVKPTQQAGEVADEVEHALANCDRLLQQAKLQASAASLTRSVRSSSGSRPPIASSTRHATPMRRSYTANGEDARVMDGTLSSPSSFSASRAFPEVQEGPYAIDDEVELEATARAMKALIASHEREMEREESAVRDQNQRTQVAQLKEIERKFESKKRMLLLSLREKCEAETRALIKQAIADQERAQQDAVTTVQEKMLADREKMLNAILARHQADTEDQIKRVQVRLQSETLMQQQELEKQLQQEHEQALCQLEQDTEVELQHWEQKQRLDMETDLLKRREQAVTSILRAQEAKMKELKHQIHDQHVTKEAEELEKLKKALAFGAQAQLQQLRKQLEADHERKMSDTRTEAAQTLENKLTDLKQVLKLAHKQELEQTQRDLEKRHRVAVMELHEKLEIDYRSQVTELSNQAAKELDTTLSTLHKELEEQNQSKLDALQQTLDRDHHVRMHQLEMDHDQECEAALARLRQEMTERNQQELDAKLSRMQKGKAALLDEAVLFLAMRPEERSAISDSTNTTVGLLQLKHLSAHLPKELQRAVTLLVQDFEELVEEQHILMEKISDSTGLYLTFKRQCTQLEADVEDLRAALQNMQSQLREKDDIAKKLYLANEALLKKLGIVEPLK